MSLRLLTAVVGMPLFIVLCAAGPLAFAWALCVVAVVGLWEMSAASRRENVTPNPILCAMGLAGPALPLVLRFVESLGRHGNETVMASLVVMVIAAMVMEVVVAYRTGVLNVTHRVGHGLLHGWYVSLFGGISMLRTLPGPSGGMVSGMDEGQAVVMVVALSIWAVDSAALFVGKSMGRRKLAPKLSPGKTVEGSIGGLIAAVLVGSIAGHIFLGSWTRGMVMGLVSGTLGQFGDLFKSCLKREVGLKDFGVAMPGHGGVLDRFDSLLATGPAIWALIVLWPS